MKKIPLDELQEKARLLTKEELKKYVWQENLEKKMGLMTLIEGDERVFVLYTPGERPKDAIDISRTRMNIYTGEGFVEYVGLERKKDS
ncbi:hypothetical protein [Budvicia aquatica]|uniref:hypothetical protein n=1 Tax=Budvicia aquatica TaxID=82979 RepID=UPI00208435A6|nr:hypothetical protein [Budvicia aquatica]GKX50335.1 hypothetical protein SOASR029_06440 [Budvicia aquatica]